jgi:hypothetical protein
MAHMIIGTDSDDLSAFERTARFLRDGNITHHQCHPLIAPPGTKMWYDLKRQGRLIAFTDEMRDRLDITTNILPKNMSRLELMEGMAEYWDRIHSPEDYTQRALGFLKGITRQPKVKDPGFRGFRQNFRMVGKTFVYFLTQVDAAQRKAFLSVVQATAKVSPALMPRMMFVHTGYVIDAKRARYASLIAREQAALERAHPEMIRPLTAETLVSAALREKMPLIARKVYEILRPHTSDRETLFRLTLTVVVDYHDRFGATFTDVDALGLQNLELTCERVLAAAKLDGCTDARDSELLPLSAPPSGFSREILDAMDRAVHVARGGWETTVEAKAS